MIITAKQGTFIKKTTASSHELPANQKVQLSTGKTFKIDKLIGGLDKGHQLVTLSYAMGDWYVFAQHWDGLTQKGINEPSPTFAKQLVTFPDGRISPVSVPVGFIQKGLAIADYHAIAKEFNINFASVRAIVDVESAGSGFNLNEPSPARPKILFEGQWFGSFTGDRYNSQHPDISSRTWKEAKRFYNQNQWNRIIKAYTINPNAALQSASWGLGQVMGFNYKVAGCQSVEELVTQAFTSEFYQLRHMMAFIQSNNLLKFIRNQDWENFAYSYNGEGYRENAYHIKLANAYRSYA